MEIEKIPPGSPTALNSAGLPGKVLFIVAPPTLDRDPSVLKITLPDVELVDISPNARLLCVEIDMAIIIFAVALAVFVTAFSDLLKQHKQAHNVMSHVSFINANSIKKIAFISLQIVEMVPSGPCFPMDMPIIMINGSDFN